MTLILLHGALGSSSQVAPLATALAGTDDVRTMELAGHGNTPLGDRAFSIGAFVAQLAEYLDHHQVARADLFGYSMGGYVALAFALEHPQRAGTVTTLGTKLAWTPDVAAKEASRCDPVTIRAKVPRFADALAARHEGAGGWEALMGRTAQLMRGLGEHPLLGDDALSRIESRVRLMVGDRDTTVSMDETLHASRSVKHGECAVLPGTPHPLEQVDLAVLGSLVLR
ncbi:MAG: alpha/beta fold hydrolase [bacterium]